jgi:hypothetical protein
MTEKGQPDSGILNVLERGRGTIVLLGIHNVAVIEPGDDKSDHG